MILISLHWFVRQWRFCVCVNVLVSRDKGARNPNTWGATFGEWDTCESIFGDLKARASCEAVTNMESSLYFYYFITSD